MRTVWHGILGQMKLEFCHRLPSINSMIWMAWMAANLPIHDFGVRVVDVAIMVFVGDTVVRTIGYFTIAKREFPD